MDPKVIPKNFLGHFIVLVVIVNLISCQQKSIVDKDNNIVLMPRDDINISLAIDGFDNNTFNNIAQRFSDNLFNATESMEEANTTESTTVEDEEDSDSAWDSDMFSDNSNSTSDLEEVFHRRAEGNDDSMFPSDREDTDSSVTTPSTTTAKMVYIQKVPRKSKPYPSASKRRRRRQIREDLNVEIDEEEQLNNEQNHFLWVRAAPRTSVSQIENSIEVNENKDKTSAVSRSSEIPKPELGWVTKVLTEAMLEFSPSLSNNSQCRAHSEMYRAHLKNLTFWAMQSK